MASEGRQLKCNVVLVPGIQGGASQAITIEPHHPSSIIHHHHHHHHHHPHHNLLQNKHQHSQLFTRALHQVALIETYQSKGQFSRSLKPKINKDLKLSRGNLVMKSTTSSTC